jgi:predicted transcriptional regulator of viral defense system
MNERTFLQKANSLGIVLLSTSDISKITGEHGQGLNTFLYRLKKRGVIERLEKGKYYLRGSDIDAIASSIISPSYISFLYALSYYNLTTQIPNEMIVVSLKSRSPVGLNGYNVRFMKMKKDRFFGMKRIKKDRQAFATFATIEKAIIDCLAYPEYCPLAEVSYAISLVVRNRQLDKERLVSMTRSVGSSVAAKRLGYLLELSGLDLYNELRPMVNESYDDLNPSLPPGGPLSSKWRLNLNQVVLDDHH